MKSIIKNLSILAFSGLGLLSSCGNNKSDENQVIAQESAAVCIWDKTSLVDKPSHKEGKWQSAISLGEKLKYLDKSKEDKADGKLRNYYKVQLLDGKEGWVQSDFVVLQATVATITHKSEIYSRPDLGTLTKKSFEPMDIIAVKSTQGDWYEVVGKRRAGKWLDNGWIKNKGISSDERDVAVAVYATRALTKPTVAEVSSELLKIKENADLSGSMFDTHISELLLKLENTASSEENTEAAPATEETPADTVYVK